MQFFIAIESGIDISWWTKLTVAEVVSLFTEIKRSLVPIIAFVNNKEEPYFWLKVNKSLLFEFISSILYEPYIQDYNFIIGKSVSSALFLPPTK